MKKSLIKIIKFFGICVAIAYPFVVFVALKKHVAVRFLALLMLAVAGISFMRNKNIWIFLCVLLFCAGLVIFNDDIFLKMYPTLMNISVCLMFALSMRDVPLIEQFATRMGYKMDAARKKYARRATCAWAIFMFCLTLCSIITVFLSDEAWVLFNGLISYILIAMMIGVEIIIRRVFIDAGGNK